MDNQWLATKETFLGYKCLKHRVTHELCLFGRHGEIWLKNSTTCKAMVRNRKVVPVKSITGLNYQEGDEAVTEFPATDITLYIKLLGVPRLFPTMQNYSKMIL